MRVSKKLGMYAGVSAAALGLALIAAPASAFDEVNWTWDAEVNETVTKTIDITADLNPTGMAMLQDLQVSIGDHTATSSVNDVVNNQPGQSAFGNGGSLEFDVVWDAAGGHIEDENAYSETSLTFNPDDDITFYDLNGERIPDDIVLGCLGNNAGMAETCAAQGRFTMVVDVDGEEVVVSQDFDALTDLPEVISAATAVANNTAIETDTAVQLHEGQFAFGDGNGDFSGDAEFDAILAALSSDENDGGLDGANSNLLAAGVLGSAAMQGMLEQAEITANSQVGNIENASVDSSATAVVNNLSVDVAAEDDDRMLIGDAVQFSYANTNAMSDVQDVSINNYTNLGAIDRAITNSVATAVGNNKSITVTTPEIE